MGGGLPLAFAMFSDRGENRRGGLWERGKGEGGGKGKPAGHEAEVFCGTPIGRVGGESELDRRIAGRVSDESRMFSVEASRGKSGRR